MNTTDRKRLQITERDRALLIALHRHGVLLRDHIHRLLFASCKMRRVNRRLTTLKQAELIEAFHIPLGAFTVGVDALLPSPGQLGYRLGTAGIPLISALLEIDTATVRRRLRAAPASVGHAVAVAMIDVALVRFQEPQGYHLESFVCESEARLRFEWRSSPTQAWKTEEIRPDALAWIERKGARIPLLFEADMSSQNVGALTQKFLGYRRAAAALQSRFRGAPIRLIFVTTTTSRLAKIAAIACESELAKGNTGIHCVALTTFEKLATFGPFAPIFTFPLTGEPSHERSLF